MSYPEKDPGKVTPLPDEPKLEDLPAEYEEENREMEGRTPDLGETEEDPSEL